MAGLLVCCWASGTAFGEGSAKPTGKSAVPMNSVTERRAQGAEGLDEALRTYDKLHAELSKLQRQQNELHSVTLFGEGGKADRNADVEAQFEQISGQISELERRIARTAAAIDQGLLGRAG
jgi:hypothetical protein